MVNPIVSAINNLKTMGGGHAVHERQAILSTTVVISHTFCMENENKLTPEGRGNNHVMLSCKSAIVRMHVCGSSKLKTRLHNLLMMINDVTKCLRVRKQPCDM